MEKHTVEKAGIDIKNPSSGIRESIIRFQYAEKIKSELIIASNLLVGLEDLREAEVEGAKKMLFSFIDALISEIIIAHRASGDQNFEEARAKVEEAVNKIRSDDYSEATRRISEAISHTTTGGQRAMQTLREKGFL